MPFHVGPAINRVDVDAPVAVTIADISPPSSCGPTKTDSLATLMRVAVEPGR